MLAELTASFARILAGPAFAALLVMLTDLIAITVSAQTALHVMLTDLRAMTFFAITALHVMMTDLRAMTFFAKAALHVIVGRRNHCRPQCPSASTRASPGVLIGTLPSILFSSVGFYFARATVAFARCMASIYY